MASLFCIKITDLIIFLERKQITSKTKQIQKRTFFYFTWIQYCVLFSFVLNYISTIHLVCTVTFSVPTTVNQVNRSLNIPCHHLQGSGGHVHVRDAKLSHGCQLGFKICSLLNTQLLSPLDFLNWSWLRGSDDVWLRSTCWWGCTSQTFTQCYGQGCIQLILSNSRTTSTPSGTWWRSPLAVKWKCKKVIKIVCYFCILWLEIQILKWCTSSKIEVSNNELFFKLIGILDVNAKLFLFLRENERHYF